MATIAAVLRYTTVPIVPSVDGLLPADLPQHNSIKLTFSSYTTGADLLQNLDALIAQKLPGRVRDSPSELLYYPPAATPSPTASSSHSAGAAETESNNGDNNNKRPQQHVSSSSRSISSPSPPPPLPVVIPLGAVLLDEPLIAERYHASLAPAVSGVPPTREQPIVFVVRRVRSQPKIKVTTTVGGDGSRSSTANAAVAVGATTLLSPATDADRLVAETMAEMRADATMATIARIEAKNAGDSNTSVDTERDKDGDTDVGGDRFSHSVPWVDRLKAFPNAAHLADTLENEEEAIGAYLRIVEQRNAELKARRTAVRDRAVAMKKEMALHQKTIVDHATEVSEKASLNEAVESLRLELEIQEKRRGELMHQLLLTRDTNSGNNNKNAFASSGISSPPPRRGPHTGTDDDDVLNSPSPLPTASPTATALAEGGPLLKQLLAEQQQQQQIKNNNTINAKDPANEDDDDDNSALARTTSAEALTKTVGISSDPTYDDALRKIQARMGIEGGVSGSSHNNRSLNMPEHGRQQEKEARRMDNNNNHRSIDGNGHSATRGPLEGMEADQIGQQRRERSSSGSSVGARREGGEGVSHHHQHHHHERFSQSPTSLASPVVDRRMHHPWPPHSHSHSHQEGGHQQHQQREAFFGGGGGSAAARRSGGYSYRDNRHHHQNPSPPPQSVMFEELAEVDDDSWLLSPELAREVAEVLDRPSPQPTAAASTKASALQLPRYLTAVKDRYTELNPANSPYGYGPRADALRPTAAALASDLGAYRKRLEESAQAPIANAPHAYARDGFNGAPTAAVSSVSELLASPDIAAYFTSAGLPPVPLPPPPHQQQQQQYYSYHQPSPSPSSYGMSRRGEELMAVLEGRRAMAVQQPFYPSNPDPQSPYVRTYEAASVAAMATSKLAPTHTSSVFGSGTGGSSPPHMRGAPSHHHHHHPHTTDYYYNNQMYGGGMNGSYAHINDSRAHHHNPYPLHPQHPNVRGPPYSHDPNTVRAHYADNTGNREGPVVGGPAGYRPAAPASWR